MDRRTPLDHPRPRSTPAASAARCVCLLTVAALVGCSGRGTYITGGPSTGQLKSSLSRIEYENGELKTQVARLKEENRRFEDRLVQEQLHNGELAARLDDMRNLMRDRGFNDPDADYDDAPLTRPRTLPAGRSSSSRRKPPAAQISRAGEAREMPPIRIDDGSRSDRPSQGARRSRPSLAPVDPDDDVGVNEKDMRWTPITAQGAALDAPPRR